LLRGVLREGGSEANRYGGEKSKVIRKGRGEKQEDDGICSPSSFLRGVKKKRQQGARKNLRIPPETSEEKDKKKKEGGKRKALRSPINSLVISN